MGAAFVVSLAGGAVADADVDADPFEARVVTDRALFADAHGGEGKCGEGKCGEKDDTVAVPSRTDETFAEKRAADCAKGMAPLSKV